MGSGDDGRDRSSSRHHRGGHQYDRSSSRHRRDELDRDRDRRYREKDRDREEREAEKERARRRDKRDREERRDRERSRRRDAGGEGGDDDVGRDRKRRRGSSHPRPGEAAPAPRNDHGTGYGGSGFKFNDEEDKAQKSTKKAQAREYGYEEDSSDSDSDEEEVRKAGDDPDVQAVGEPGANDEARLHALEILTRIQRNVAPGHHTEELEINDFPQYARWKITHKDTLSPIQDGGAAITIKGTYIAQGKTIGANDCKLYLFIEGPSESCVKKAKAELKRVLEDCVNQAPNLPKSAPTKKYSVI